MPRTLRAAPVAALLATSLLAACGGGQSNAFQQEVRLASTPPGAACEIRRGNALLTQVAATPATMRIGKSSDPLAVTCTAPGFQASRTAVAATENAGMVAAYALAGGLVGIIAAANSGDLYSYPAAVEVTLWPASFPDAASRDAFFDRLTQETEAFHAGRMANQPRCAGDDTGCIARAAAREDAKQQDLAAVRAGREAARIGL